MAIMLVYLLFRGVLPQDGWKMLAALSATWTGGSANLVAVKQIIGLSESSLPPVLLADALVLLGVGAGAVLDAAPFATRFNRWTRAGSRAYPELTAPTTRAGRRGRHSAVARNRAVRRRRRRAARGASLPASTMLTTTSWTVLIATVAGLIVARTPLATSSGPAPLASALLALLVAVLASQSNFDGMASAPLFILVRRCSRC